jgi:hypothetical protein
VAGCVNYRGYYSKDAAESYAKELRDAGDDVEVGGVAARDHGDHQPEHDRPDREPAGSATGPRRLHFGLLHRQVTCAPHGGMPGIVFGRSAIAGPIGRISSHHPREEHR